MMARGEPNHRHADFKKLSSTTYQHLRALSVKLPVELRGCQVLLVTVFDPGLGTKVDTPFAP
jgi:hypothetical protein